MKRPLLLAAFIVALFANSLFSLQAGNLQLTFTNLDSGTTADLSSIAIGNGKYVAASPTLNSSVIRSADGIHWEPLGGGVTGSAVFFGNGQFILLGSVVSSSQDTVNWTPADAGSLPVVGAAFGNGVFVLVGQEFRVSADAVHWQVVTNPPNYTFSVIAFKDGTFTATGSYHFKSAFYEVIAQSTNGVNWTFKQGINFSLLADNLRITAVANGRYFANRSSFPGAFYTSTNGLDWTLFSKLDPGTFQPQVLRFLNDRLVGLSISNPGQIYIEHGGTFDTVNPGTTNRLNDAAFDGSEYLFVGASGTIIKSKGASALGSSLKVNSIANGSVNLSINGSANASYGLQAISTTAQFPISTSNLFEFTLSATTTNYSLPISTSGSTYFRLVER